MPLRKKPYTITFFYDLAFEKFPKMYPESFSKLKRESRNSAETSNAILSVSDSTKKDLIKFYKTGVKKIRVSYPGVSKKFKAAGKKYKSKNPYFLFVGSLKKTKNVPGIIKAFHYFLKKSGLNFDLYIAGGDKWFDNEIRQVSKNTLGSSVKFLGFVEEDKLASLYRGATAFVSPSFYEGFGLPMLEAMKSGCPVISSKSGSVPEVVENAGILVNPNSQKEIGEAMITITRNLKKRTSLVNRGLKRAEDFSWIRFAEDVMDLINKRR
ncbi:MAG: glycosyltransferase family 1 protein [Candidatus Levyibacteriota bacterium]